MTDALLTLAKAIWANDETREQIRYPMTEQIGVPVWHGDSDNALIEGCSWSRADWERVVDHLRGDGTLSYWAASWAPVVIAISRVGA